MHDFRGEGQLVAIELSGLEELIQERSLVALAVAEARDESGDVACVFHRHLHEFAFFQERVHAGILMAILIVRLCRWRGRLRLLRAQLRRKGQRSESEHQETE